MGKINSQVSFLFSLYYILKSINSQRCTKSARKEQFIDNQKLYNYFKYMVRYEFEILVANWIYFWLVQGSKRSFHSKCSFIQNSSERETDKAGIQHCWDHWRPMERSPRRPQRRKQDL